jgi:hypothetical protein
MASVSANTHPEHESMMRPTIVSHSLGALGALVLLVSSAAAQGRSTVSVTVTDAQSGSPLVGAEVVLPQLKLVHLTDAQGQARVAGVAAGEHRVRVRMLGYDASDTTLRVGSDTGTVQFRLERSAATLPTVAVTASEVPAPLRDFEARRKQGLGRYLTESDLAGDADRDFSLVATMKFPGLSLQTNTDGRPQIASMRSNCGSEAARVSTDNRGVERIGGKPGMKSGLGDRGIDGEPQMKGSCSNMRPCLVPIYLDNIEMGEADANIVRTWDLSGAEFYTPSNVPARYRRSGAACGVLLLWSKWR